MTNVLQAAASDDSPQEPQSEQAGDREADHGDDVDAEQVRPACRKDPDQAGTDEPAGYDHRHHEPVEDDVDLGHQVVEALVDETDLDLPVAHLLQRVVNLVRELERDLAEAERLLTEELRPIDDLRSTAAYRRQVAVNLLRAALE